MGTTFVKRIANRVQFCIYFEFQQCCKMQYSELNIVILLTSTVYAHLWYIYQGLGQNNLIKYTCTRTSRNIFILIEYILVVVVFF